MMGGTLQSQEPFAGGSLSSVIRVILEDGREALVKSGPAPKAEARMLQAIAEAGCPAPRVFAADDEALVIERLPDDGGLGSAWEDLGEVLRRLHETTGERYGWADDYAFGPLQIANGWKDDWPAFFAEHRLLPPLSGVASDLAARVERLAAQIHDHLPARPASALLHGDMWSGNVLAFEGRISGLIDPACYYGDREVDIAMLTLFASPSARFFDAYGGQAPGYRERLPIYQLWPALVHLRLFGGGYRGMVERFLAQTGF